MSELETLIRTAALEAVQAALGGASAAKQSSLTAAAAKPAAPKASGASSSAPKVAPSPSTQASVPAVKRVKKGTRRSAEDVAAAARTIKAHLAAHPGQGVEAIAKALGVPSKDLALPITNLLGARSIRKEGEKRGTRYFLTGASEGKAPLAPQGGKK
ncbi:MAG: DNA-binding protein [Sandaracinaceae bacterium]|nr:DNA-binding protein [Sandaracinaceae bacterium]